MDIAKREKVNRFLNDKVMSQTVYDILLESFLRKEKGSDVNMLAASMLAVYALEDAWKELQSLKNESVKEIKELSQIGL